MNSYRLRGAFPRTGSPAVEVTDARRSKILDKRITEVIYYKNSVAAVLSPFSVAPMYVIYYYTLEDGEWLGAGEGLGNDLDDAREKLRDTARKFLGCVERIAELKSEPKGAGARVGDLRSGCQRRAEFLLCAWKEHKIVAYV